MNSSLLAQLAPQRSTQYSQLVSDLGPAEAALSPLGPSIASISPTRLGNLSYLRIELDREPDPDGLSELGSAATIGALFTLYDQIAEVDGPLLRPIEITPTRTLPEHLVEARRYRGKTNELFTHFLLNIARWSSNYRHQPWSSLRVIDPLMGGGTTLLAGLILGADVAGIERSTEDTESTATFLLNFCREEGITCRMDREKRSTLDRRWWFQIGKKSPQRALMVNGDGSRPEAHLEGFRRPHLIVTDLPYGVQHKGSLETLLEAALPAWESLLLPGGTLTYSWESSRFPRERMVSMIQAHTTLNLLNEPPFDSLAHRVDRVIRKRDVIVARRADG